MTQTAPRYEAKVDHMPIEAIDHIAFWVGNAKQAAHFYTTAMGFEQVAYAGPETGMRGLASYVLRQGQITILLTSGMGPEDAITKFCHEHGDGVRRIALRVPDARAAFSGAVARGATPAAPAAPVCSCTATCCWGLSSARTTTAPTGPGSRALRAPAGSPVASAWRPSTTWSATSSSAG
jgi:4-hydroxyphenylpyruvate dioxygenase-like putative hemolysin